MKPLSKKLWIIFAAAVVIVIVISFLAGRGISQAKRLVDSNVIFVNESRVPVGSVGYFSPMESGGACNADSSLLERGETLYFDVEFPCTLTVYADAEGMAPLLSAVVEEEPPGSLEEGVWYVIARDGPEGMMLTLSLNLDEEELETMAGSISKNLGVDVSGGAISYCWYPGRGINGDGEDFVAVKFSRQEGDALERQLAAADGWQAGEFPEEMKADTFDSVYTHESHIDWNRVSDRGWFYYRDEKKTDSDSIYNVDLTPYSSSDYVAAVYDVSARTLYFFEWHQ